MLFETHKKSASGKTLCPLRACACACASRLSLAAHALLTPTAFEHAVRSRSASAGVACRWARLARRSAGALPGWGTGVEIGDFGEAPEGRRGLIFGTGGEGSHLGPIGSP